MLVRMRSDATAEEGDRVAEVLGIGGRNLHRVGPDLVVAGGEGGAGAVESLPGVECVLEPGTPYALVHRSARPQGTRVRVGPVEIGGECFVIIAGPCAVESPDQMDRTARAVASSGATILRGGAFKPRTSPYAFRGLGERGLEMLASAGHRLGMPVVTEVLTAEDVPQVAAYADMLQIGARNMQNFLLLEAAGRSGKPVLLKRGLAATIEEWLLAAEYIALQGNPNIVLCERGIRTFETATRNTLDLASAVLAAGMTHLPVIVDPSHATGQRALVGPLARAAASAGMPGVILEVHPEPDCALCDGPQSLTLDQFRSLADGLATLAALEGRGLSRCSSAPTDEADVDFQRARLEGLDTAISRLAREREKTRVQIQELEARIVRLT